MDYEKEILKMENELLEKVKKFMIDNNVSCEDTIYQCDWVIENAYEFIADCFNIVKPVLPIDED